MRNFFEQVYEIVKLIPEGKVTSYGRIAQMLGRPNSARAVGYALNALKNSAEHEIVPWWRVVNAAGKISLGSRELLANRQAILLQKEGVRVSDELAISLSRFLWEGADIFEIEEILQHGQTDHPY